MRPNQGTPPNQNPNPPQPQVGAPPNQFDAQPNRPPYPPPNQNRNQPQPPQPPQGAPNPGSETGTEGIFRLFNQQLAGQATWLLPLALFSLVVLLARLPFNNEHRAALMWGAWLIPQIIFFSYAGLFHRYYLEMMAPAIAALVGAGVMLMWNSLPRLTVARLAAACSLDHRGGDRVFYRLASMLNGVGGSRRSSAASP